MLGQTIGGRYRIIRQIGKGGFGVTCLAEDIQRPGNPRCVVKQLKPMTTDPYTLRAGKILFEREAEVQENLGNHHQIPKLLAHFEENQEFYLVQKYTEVWNNTGASRLAGSPCPKIPCGDTASYANGSGRVSPDRISGVLQDGYLPLDG